MPENAIYLQVAFALTIVSLAVYVGYALVRLRQAQDELRSLRSAHLSGQLPDSAGPAQPLRSAQEPPAHR